MPAEDYRLYDEAYCNPIVIDVCDSQALGGYRYHTGPGMKGFGIGFWWKLHPMVPLTLPPVENITSSPTTGFSCWNQLRSKPAMGVTVFQRTQVAELSMLSTRSHDEK